jgi:RNA polymerase sigma factor (sigma-70 family)
MAHWEDELDELARRRGRALVGYAYVLCGEQRLAEDLVQDALVKVFARLRRTAPSIPGATRGSGVYPLDSGNGTSEAYVRRAILTLYLDEYRRRRRRRSVEHLAADADLVRNPASGATARADVAAALGRLSPRQRACVVLRYFEDLTVPQVADQLGLAPGTVKRYLADASATLRGLLQVPDDDTLDGTPDEDHHDTASTTSRTRQTATDRRAAR